MAIWRACRDDANFGIDTEFTEYNAERFEKGDGKIMAEPGLNGSTLEDWEDAFKRGYFIRKVV